MTSFFKKSIVELFTAPRPSLFGGLLFRRRFCSSCLYLVAAAAAASAGVVAVGRHVLKVHGLILDLHLDGVVVARAVAAVAAGAAVAVAGEGEAGGSRGRRRRASSFRGYLEKKI